MAKRSDEKIVTKPVKVARLAKPNFLTLTKSPANEVAFKLIRKDEPVKPEDQSPNKVVRQRTVRRMDATLMFIFAEGTTEDDINATMLEFGISDYSIGVSVDGMPIVTRADATEPFPESYITVNLRNGVKALVAQGVAVATDENPTPNIAVVAIEFAKTFDQAAIETWLNSNDIDPAKTTIVAGEDVTTVNRITITEGAEVRRMDMAEGIQVVIMPTAVQDVPPSIVEVISEAAYGSWGWGQLDFAAAMADCEFCEMTREGSSMLRDVLDKILFYSYLPVSVRKELVVRATSQFAAYIGALLDALPTRVITSYTSDLKEKLTMKTKDQLDAERQVLDDAKRADEVTKNAGLARTWLKANVADKDGKPLTDAGLMKRSDAEVIELHRVGLADAEKKVQDEADKQPVTRGEIAALITAAVTAAIKEVGTQRTDTKDEKVADPVVTDPVKKDAPDPAAILAEAVRSAVEPLVKSAQLTLTRLEKLEGATTVRSDGGDTKQTEKKPDTFAGIFRHSANA
jgi:hypothetical protein